MAVEIYREMRVKMMLFGRGVALEVGGDGGRT
jgi:hypothetical protein